MVVKNRMFKWLCCCIFAVTSISLCCSFFGDKFFEPSYEKIADAITADIAEKIKKEKNLILIGTGGRMMNDIQMMAMSFNCYSEVGFDTARKLLVYCVKEYLAAINGSEKVRPYLHNYPFTVQNIEIVIYFYTQEHGKLPAGKITIASADEGNIKYQTDNPNGNTLDTLRIETYDDAVKKVAQGSASE